MADEQQLAPMRVQVKADDGTEHGVWLTVFEGWTDLLASQRAVDETTALASAIQLGQEEETS